MPAVSNQVGLNHYNLDQLCELSWFAQQSSDLLYLLYIKKKASTKAPLEPQFLKIVGHHHAQLLVLNPILVGPFLPPVLVEGGANCFLQK